MVNYYLHIIAVALLTVSILLAFFHYQASYARLWASLQDLWLSLRAYGGIWFDYEISSEAMGTLPELNLQEYSPFDWAGLQHKLGAVWGVLFNKDYFLLYFSWLMDSSYLLLMFASILIPLFFLLKNTFFNRLFRQNNDYNEDTRTLAFWKRRMEPIGNKVFCAVRTVFSFVRSSDYFTLFLLIWCLNLNVVTIFVEFFAYYIDFLVNVSLQHLLIYIVKLLADLLIMLSGAPFLFWAVLICLLLNYIRKKIGYDRLNHMELMNRGFINALPIQSLIVGTTGASKTTSVTDMAISQEILFRDKALELLQKNALKFPFFPWINLELEIKSQVEHGCIYNLASIEDWGECLKEQFGENPTKEMLFGYDFDRYPVTYQDDLRMYDILGVIVTYAKLFFIYMVESALIVSNYCIRLDFQRDDCGNFPVWNHNLFEWDVEDLPRLDMTSHIIDFDMIRLGKKVVENNVWSGALEFGVVVASEFGKERKNSKELTETKKSTDETNQKNDLADYWFKMCRHGAVVDNFPFIKFFSDEQRPESLGANTRDLFSVVRIRKTVESNICLPFYAAEGFLYETLKPKYFDLDAKLRYYRGDNTLTGYLIKRVWQPFYAHCERLENRFGYTVKKIQIEDGSLDGEREEHKYYLMPKKIYSDRFRTDSFAPIFRSRAKKCGHGLIQRECYQNLDATPEELESQNSYAVGDMFGKMM